MTDGTALRTATITDVPALAEFARDAFVAAFGTLYAADDLAAFLAEARCQASYRAHLADPKKRICLAERDGRIAGYALIVLGEGFPERPAPQPARPIMLSQLYCGAGTTGLGIGAALMQWALDEAQGWGADAIQLSVYSENTGAQRFYGRHGFAHVADLDFWVGNKRDDEFLYELSLG